MSIFEGGCQKMRKIISFILALILSVSCIFTAITSYADDRAHIEDTLNALETQAGYIPFQYSSVQYNCFGFISDVCAKLYGVTYNNEIQSGNYRFVHTQNYFTVAQTTYPYTADSATLSNYAQWLKDWLLANAAVGDVLQIGCANDGYSKKHTVLIQHIDEEKIMLYHANYATNHRFLLSTHVACDICIGRVKNGFNMPFSFWTSIFEFIGIRLQPFDWLKSFIRKISEGVNSEYTLPHLFKQTHVPFTEFSNGSNILSVSLLKTSITLSYIPSSLSENFLNNDTINSVPTLSASEA